jgi:hypothetical protein
MRNLPNVIDQMLSEIPSGEVSLRAGLEDIIDSVMYSSPEGIGMWWRSTAELLHEEFGNHPPDDGWQGKVVDIWMDRIGQKNGS